MAITLVTRNSDSSPVLKYTALGALAAGQVHAHAMATPRVVHAHEDASTPEGIIHLENHAHTINFYKYHRHFIESLEPLVHSHEGTVEHKHKIAYHDDTYKYSVTRQTGTDAPVVTPDVGTAAVIRVPDGASETDTGNADVVVELANTETCGDDDHLAIGASTSYGYYEPGDNYATVDTATDIVEDISVGLSLSETPQSKVVTTSATTDAALHKGVVGANPAVQANANGDNNKAIMLDATDSLAGDIIGIGSGGAAGYSNTYHKQTPPTGDYHQEPQPDNDPTIYSPSVSGFAGWAFYSYDPSWQWPYRMFRFYKLGTSPEGVWTPRTCNEVLSVNPDMTDIPSTLAFVGTYNLGSEGYGIEQWIDTAENYVVYDTNAWYIYNYYSGVYAYKKLASDAFDPTGEYVGVSPNTGTYVVSSTQQLGGFRAAWKTLPELQYSPIKKAYHGQHQHDITDTPDYTSLEHDHDTQMYDYQHRHQCDFPKHKHTPPDGADFAAHKHTVTLTDHSHEPVVYGIWRTVSILSNVTFKRVDDVSPWVLFAVDTIQVDYPSPTVGAEVADVEWPVSKLALTLELESTVDLATDIDPTIGQLDAGAQEGNRYTNQVTIEDIPLVFGDYIAGDPELEWVTGAKTALAYHIGKGEAAGTAEEQSLVSPLDDTHSVLIRNDGVLERMRIGRLPTGIAHTHSYTDKAFKLLAHPHDIVFPWRGEIAHTHTMYLADPHSHPKKHISAESHKHNVVACDSTPHTHDVNSIEEASEFVTGIDNVVDDTFDEEIDSSLTVCYPLSTGTDNGAETGVATVTTADNAWSMLHVVSTEDPTLNGDYQKTFKSVTGNGFYLVRWVKVDDATKSFGDNGIGWYDMYTGTHFAYRPYSSGPVGDYSDPYSSSAVYATVTNSTALGVKDVGISRDVTTSAEKKFVPHKDYGKSYLNSYIWDWTAETFDPVISSFETGLPEGNLTAVTYDGEVDFTMTGAVDEKLHEGI